MKRTALALTLILSLLLSGVAGALLVNVVKASSAQYLPEITINPDGSVVPETEYITRTGNLYTLTRNISREPSIIINCSNIVFDGTGHTSKGNKLNPYDVLTGLRVNGENITVKDLKITGFIYYDIWCDVGRNCTFLRVEAEKVFLMGNAYGGYNTISESNITRLSFFNSGCHTIIRNNISDLHGMDSGGSTFYENNFPNVSSVSIHRSYDISWDNGLIGNYWGDYQERYPNASEIGSSGIGDTPYVIDAYHTDNYPLLVPFIVPPSPEPHPEELFLTILIATSVATVAVVCAGLLVYLKKRQRGQSS